MTVPLPASKSVSWLLLMLVSATLLCACGQTGALYLPEETAEQEPKPKQRTGDNH